MQLVSDVQSELSSSCRLGSEGFRALLPELSGDSGAELLLEDEEGEQASRWAEDAANIAQAVAAALAADSGLRKALLRVSQSAACVPLLFAAFGPSIKSLENHASRSVLCS